jgi:RNA polymerase sigma-70 factor (ECF subfamily)
MENESELLARWRAGDTEAGGELFGQSFPSIRRFFANKANDVVEDLIQETFARCLTSFATFEGRSSFRAFALGIARNVLLEYYRRRTKQESVDFGVTSVVAMDPSPSQYAAEAQENVRVNEALRSLPLDHQIALELRYWENLSVVEVAEITCVPVGTVKSRLFAARKGLQRILGEESASL